MSDLRTRATAARGAGPPTGNGRGDGHAEPIIDFEVGPEPEAVPVRVAWTRVMRFCRGLTKGSTAKVMKDGKVLYTYTYRGVDDVVSLAGRALREFGVIVTPIKVEPSYRVQGGGTICTAIVTYEVTSLGEGSFPIVVAAEGVDFGDKATIKMMQQALRLCYVHGLALPTHNPRYDSDADPVQLPEPPGPFGLRDEILDKSTSMQRLKTIHSELKRDPDLAGTIVPVNGADETLWDLVVRVATARLAESEGGQ